MRRVSSNTVSVKFLRAILAVLLLIGAGPLSTLPASAATLDQRSLLMVSNRPNATTVYTASFTLATPGTLGSIVIEFCDNTAIFGVACNAPPGFDISNAGLGAETGETGFNVDALTTTNKLVLSRSPAVTVGGPVSYRLTNVRNASALGVSYARISTYATSNASGPATDQGGLAYQLGNPISLAAEVPPYIELCVAVNITGFDCNTAAGDYVNMGDFVTTRASTGLTQMVVSTNADFGYVISVSGNSMTSGNNVIPPLATPLASLPGTSQFGINLRANTVPVFGQDPGGNGFGQPTTDYNIPNRFKYSSGDVIASYNDVEDHRKYTVGYLVNINRNQSPGIYSSTFTYTATGNF